MKYEELINEAFDNGINQSNRNDVNNAVEKVLNDLNEGVIRVAENSKGNWNVNEYAKKAILLSFKLNQNKCIETNYTKFYDKVDSKFLHTTEDYLKKNNIRIVPQAIARHGSFIDKNVVLMPSFVNIGDNVNSGDTICIVEAMKIMNEIQAEESGVIEEILVDNSSPVEFDQVLFKLKPSK